ncbi:hypothetical protein IU433_00715 [Nocardia puris]|uniref:Polyketide cyclase/dehydrase/lipid transport protein n=2 Tax=Nocardia puris TaxID=208602 RepID=A0A366DUG5_9NOCA|nr:hypothetical protein [Nocardia puris]MBF6367380.1 hypothetical protein [Nocardia puris]MBF6457565.1 hypothetical protein [Nocardia puris]RBO93727.1 hypothetical protein DFR74_102144 [Nocardia puris]
MTPGQVWGATEAECETPLPCDRVLPGAFAADRAISIDAPPALVFGWLCQLRVAPYSYDLLNNLGRRSPRRRDPELTELAVGQRFMRLFTLESFVLGRHLTLVSGDGICVTYAVRAEGGGTRLAVRVRCAAPAFAARLLVAGDVIMMRKQLRTLRALAEAEARDARAAAGES